MSEYTKKPSEITRKKYPINIDEQKINADLYVYLKQMSKKKFVISVMDEHGSDTVSSHSRLEKAEESFDETIKKLAPLPEGMVLGKTYNFSYSATCLMLVERNED